MDRDRTGEPPHDSSSPSICLGLRSRSGRLTIGVEPRGAAPRFYRRAASGSNARLGGDSLDLEVEFFVQPRPLDGAHATPQEANAIPAYEPILPHVHPVRNLAGQRSNRFAQSVTAHQLGFVAERTGECRPIVTNVVHPDMLDLLAIADRGLDTET